LLGLAGVQERRGSFIDALPTAQKAYDFYKEKDKQRGWETSLTAKAGMQLSKIHMKLGNLDKAKTHVDEAIRLFEMTAGDDTPLLAGAYDRLGEILLLLGREDSQNAFYKSYQLEAIKDAFDLVPILEIHNKLVDSHLKTTGLNRKAFKNYFGVIGQVVERVRREFKQDGNAGAYYKSAGEMYVLGDVCHKGRPLLQEAIRLFRIETAIDTSGLIQQSADLVSYCDGTYEAEKVSAEKEL